MAVTILDAKTALIRIDLQKRHCGLSNREP
jgi:hypothetical protein